MTSKLLRTLLVAAAGVGALSIAACAKPAETPAPEATAAADAAAPAAAEAAAPAAAEAAAPAAAEAAAPAAADAAAPAAAEAAK